MSNPFAAGQAASRAAQDAMRRARQLGDDQRRLRDMPPPGGGCFSRMIGCLFMVLFLVAALAFMAWFGHEAGAF